MLLVGVSKAAVNVFCGRMLVNPLRVIAFLMPSPGFDLATVLPGEVVLCGLPIFVQGLQADGGACGSVALTPGLELVFGD